MCVTWDDERGCECSDDATWQSLTEAATWREAAGRRLEAAFAPLLGAQGTATVVPIPTTSRPARWPLTPFTGSPQLDPQHHWGVTSMVIPVATVEEETEDGRMVEHYERSIYGETRFVGMVWRPY